MSNPPPSTSASDTQQDLGHSVGLIWAQDEGGVIGVDGSVPWHVPEDLAHFAAVTLGMSVIMGRKTWESLPPRYRPLPGRRNIVISRNPALQCPGAHVASSLQSALALATPTVPISPTPSPTVWVIGGGQIYRESMAVATRLEVTEIKGRYEGDAHAPEIDRTWVLVGTEPGLGWLTSRMGIEYRFLTYEHDHELDR